MKKLKITAPEGMEIEFDKENGVILFNKKEERELPLSVEGVSGRRWFINHGNGEVDGVPRDGRKGHILSSKERTEAFLALMQLVELRDAWNGEWRPDWDTSDPKYILERSYNEDINVEQSSSYPRILHFKSEALAERFLKQFKDLIETAKELL